LPTGQEKAGVFWWFLMLKRYTAIFGSRERPAVDLQVGQVEREDVVGVGNLACPRGRDFAAIVPLTINSLPAGGALSAGLRDCLSVMSSSFQSPTASSRAANCQTTTFLPAKRSSPWANSRLSISRVAYAPSSFRRIVSTGRFSAKLSCSANPGRATPVHHLQRVDVGEAVAQQQDFGGRIGPPRLARRVGHRADRHDFLAKTPWFCRSLSIIAMIAEVLTSWN
jgi:hypothetical protein